MDPKLIGPARALLWAVAALLFIIGGYSDTSTTEMWGWGFALSVVGLLLGELPALMGMGKRQQ